MVSTVSAPTPLKPSNDAALAAAETGEERGGAKGKGLSCLDGALLASRFLSLMLLRGGLGAVMSPALMRGTL
jgi:hypothetical protein